MQPSKRCCIFVDGENFRYGILRLFPEFNQAEYLPKKAQWADLFDEWTKQACPGGERVRAYWYVIEHLDFSPRNPPKGENLTEAQKVQAADRDRMRRRFDGWRFVQDSIALRHAGVEFRRAGAITYRLADKTFGKEKAVDVKLACDLLMLRDIYDVAVIVSGDQDYVPAVQFAKDAGKRVVNVAFEERNGQLYPGGARRLNQITDESIRVSHESLARFLGIRRRRTVSLT